MKKVGLAFLLVVVVLLSGCNGQTSNDNAVTDPNSDSIPINNGNQVSIEIKDFAFVPSQITINNGDTVTWTNMDSVKHTVTSDTGDELNSDLFGNGEKYSHTFNEEGEFNYHCIPHPSMKGTVIVK